VSTERCVNPFKFVSQPSQSFQFDGLKLHRASVFWLSHFTQIVHCSRGFQYLGFAKHAQGRVVLDGVGGLFVADVFDEGGVESSSENDNTHCGCAGRWRLRPRSSAGQLHKKGPCVEPQLSSLLLLGTGKLHTPFIVRVAERLPSCGRTLAFCWSKRAMFQASVSQQGCHGWAADQLGRGSDKSARDIAPTQPFRPPSSTRLSSLPLECENSNVGGQITTFGMNTFTCTIRTRSCKQSGEMQKAPYCSQGDSAQQ
jgi:hypothetical protein